jgi:hypothetical protein
VLSGNIVAIFFIFFLCPETGGRTLEQVDYLFQKGALAFKTIDTEDGEAWSERGEETGDVMVHEMAKQ